MSFREGGIASGFLIITESIVFAACFGYLIAFCHGDPFFKKNF